MFIKKRISLTILYTILLHTIGCFLRFTGFLTEEDLVAEQERAVDLIERDSNGDIKPLLGAVVFTRNNDGLF